jgi:glutamate-1-semialdehyde 2,1-aminomutase
MERGVASPWEATDAWTLRGRACDARAVTRGDILPDAASGEPTFPRYAARAQGAYVWDVDGRRYVDYLLGYGPVVLGHADPRVTAAVTAELAHGTCMSPLWSPRQVELTELLTATIPGAELALLLKTGSDATSAAVRLARIHTGREKVVRWGYNGWHDWAAEQPAGVPAGTRAATLRFAHDPASLRAVLERHAGEVACVMTMPFDEEVVPDGALAELRAATHEHGALLVFDEMRSGFRMALGGAQERFSVQADLATFSKAMANGYAISALTGRAEILERLTETKISSTFYASPIEMVAALTTIGILRDTDAIDRLWAIGRALQDGLRALAAAHGVAAEVVGYPPMPFLRFLEPDGARRAQVKRRFYAETTRRGQLLHPDHQWFVSAAHTDADVEQTLAACDEAFRTLVDEGLA